MAQASSSSSIFGEVAEFADNLSCQPTQFLDTKDKLKELKSNILYITKAIYDAHQRSPLIDSTATTKRSRAKDPLGPINELLVEGFDEDQVWEQIALRNEPLIDNLEAKARDLQRFAVQHLQTSSLTEKSAKKGSKKERRKKNELGSSSDEGNPLEFLFFPVAVDDENDSDDQDDDDLGEEESEDWSDSEDEEVSSAEDDDDDDDQPRSTKRRGDFPKNFNPDDPFDPEELQRFLEVTDRMDAELFNKDTVDEKPDEAYDSDEAAADALLYGSKDKKQKKAKKFSRTPLDGPDDDDDDDGDDDDDDDDGEEDDDDLFDYSQDDFDDYVEEERSASQSSRAGRDFDDDDDEEDDLARNEEMMSRFLREEARRKEEIDELESKSVAKKEWTMRGEVEGSHRPDNSLLEVDLEFEHATEPAPQITTDYTAKLEELITRRILEGRFDDVVRKTQADIENAKKKPRVIPELQDTQSQLGLAEEYEQSYMEEAGKWQKTDKAEQLRKHIGGMFRGICERLDALANFSYTPKLPGNEEEVVPNAPALQIEEVAPTGVSDAALLAPEEVFARMKGDVEAAPAELSHDERRTQRRARKRQRNKELRQQVADQKTVDRLNPGLGNKQAKAKALDQLAHSRNVDIGKEGVSSVTGSSALFKQLQEEAASIAKQLSSADNDDTELPTLGKRYSKKRAPLSANHKL